MNKREFLELISWFSLGANFTLPLLSHLAKQQDPPISDHYYHTFVGVNNSNKINKKRVEDAQYIYRYLIKGISDSLPSPFFNGRDGKVKKFTTIEREVDKLLQNPIYPRDLVALCTIQENFKVEYSKMDLALSAAGLFITPIGVLSTVKSYLDDEFKMLNRKEAESFKRFLCIEASKKFNQQEENVEQYLKTKHDLEWSITESTVFENVIDSSLEAAIKNKLLTEEDSKAMFFESTLVFLEKAKENMAKAKEDLAELEKQEFLKDMDNIRNSFQLASNLAFILGENELAVKLIQFGNITTQILETYKAMRYQNPPISDLAAFTSITGIVVSIISLYQEPKEDPTNLMLQEIYKKMIEGFVNLQEQINGIQVILQESFSVVFKNQAVIIETLNALYTEILEQKLSTAQRLESIEEKLNNERKEDQLARRQTLITNFNTSITKARVFWNTTGNNYNTSEGKNLIGNVFAELLSYMDHSAYHSSFTNYNPTDSIEEFLIKFQDINQLVEALPIMPLVLHKTSGIRIPNIAPLININEWGRAAEAIYLVLNYNPKIHFDKKEFHKIFRNQLTTKFVKESLDKIIGHGANVNQFVKSLDKKLFDQLQKNCVEYIFNLFELLKNYLTEEEATLTNNRAIYTYLPSIKFVSFDKIGWTYRRNRKVQSEQEWLTDQCLREEGKAEESCHIKVWKELSYNILMLFDHPDFLKTHDTEAIVNQDPKFDLLSFLIDTKAISVIDQKYAYPNDRIIIYDGKPNQYNVSQTECKFVINVGKWKGFSFIGAKASSNGKFCQYTLNSRIQFSNEFIKNYPNGLKGVLANAYEYAPKIKDLLLDFVDHLDAPPDEYFLEASANFNDKIGSHNFGLSDLRNSTIYLDLFLEVLIDRNKILKNELIARLDHFEATHKDFIKNFDFHSTAFSLFLNLYEQKSINKYEPLGAIAHNKLTSWKSIRTELEKEHRGLDVNIEELKVEGTEFVLPQEEPVNAMVESEYHLRFKELLEIEKHPYLYINHLLGRVFSSSSPNLFKRIATINSLEEGFEQGLNYITRTNTFLNFYKELKS